VVAPPDLLRAVLDDADGRLPGAVEEPPVDARQPDGVDALALQAGDQLGVEVAEDHLEHLHGLGVGEPADDAARRLDVLRLDTEPFERVVDGRRAAVDQHHVLAVFVERCDVREGARRVDRAGATDLDDSCH
jgi:hypothetical protein